MPDRFRKFTDEELDTLRQSVHALAVPPESPEMDHLIVFSEEIEHEQTQRKHAAARQLVPA